MNINLIEILRGELYLKKKSGLIIAAIVIAVVGLLIFKNMPTSNQTSIAPQVSTASLQEQINLAYQEKKPMWLLFHSQT